MTSAVDDYHCPYFFQLKYLLAQFVALSLNKSVEYLDLLLPRVMLLSLGGQILLPYTCPICPSGRFLIDRLSEAFFTGHFACHIWLGLFFRPCPWKASGLFSTSLDSPFFYVSLYYHVIIAIISTVVSRVMVCVLCCPLGVICCIFDPF